MPSLGHPDHWLPAPPHGAFHAAIDAPVYASAHAAGGPTVYASVTPCRRLRRAAVHR